MALFSHMFLISPSVCSSGMLCFVTVTFSFLCFFTCIFSQLINDYVDQIEEKVYPKGLQLK